LKLKKPAHGIIPECPNLIDQLGGSAPYPLEYQLRRGGILEYYLRNLGIPEILET